MIDDIQGTFMNETPTRPKANDPAIMTAAVQAVIGDLRSWADAMGIKHTTDDGDTREFDALINVAILESDDGYGAARYIDTMFDWPVDTRLVLILEAVYKTAQALIPQFVQKWVMATGTRFPAKKGNGVHVRIGDAEFTGIVTEVLQTEARGWIEVLNSKVKGRVIAINSEEVIKITSTGDGRVPTPPNTPTGGTPVAARTHGEKLLKELRVA